MFDYTLTPGPTSSEVTSGANFKAVDLFNRFFTDDVWDLLVEGMLLSILAPDPMLARGRKLVRTR